MKLTDLQKTILGAMSLAPMTGVEIMRACQYGAGNRSFANALLRLRDAGLIDCATLDPITYTPTPKGLGALADASLSPHQPDQQGSGT